MGSGKQTPLQLFFLSEQEWWLPLSSVQNVPMCSLGATNNSTEGVVQQGAGLERVFLSLLMGLIWGVWVKIWFNQKKTPTYINTVEDVINCDREQELPKHFLLTSTLFFPLLFLLQGCWLKTCFPWVLLAHSLWECHPVLPI